MSIDLRLDGSDMGTDLNIRLVFFSGSSRWTSTTAYDLGNDAGWQSVTFDVAEASLTSVRGSSTYSEVLGDVTKFMIRHNAGDP